MTDLEKKIYQAIAESKGIKGSEIANKINEDKKTVNSVLSRSDALRALVIQDNNYRWMLRHATSPEKKQHATENVPVPDIELNNLCRYYLNCIALESSGSVSQFLTSKFALKYAYIHDLEINPNKEEEAITLLKNIGPDRNKKVYLGYPVRVFTIWGKNNTKYKKIAPVFMFALNYEGGKIDLSSIPSINMDVLKAYTGSKTDDVVIELVNLENELGLDTLDADVEKDELVLRLIDIRQWDYKEKIDPYHISVAPLEPTVADGIYNRAIVIEAEREPYTQGLESELMSLANMPTENFKGTALYSWLKGQNSIVHNDNIKPLLEVKELNSEQAEAVNTALRSDLTIVTGPPGTGKSQVVTDLLINIIWNGKRALFSSKNNKAVDVVDLRVNSISKRPVLLRMGGTQHASRLAEIIEGLLNSHAKEEDKSEAEFYYREYSRLSKEAAAIQDEKRKTVAARNHLDEIEQKYCLVRDSIGKYITAGDIPLEGQIITATKQYVTAHHAACKEKQNLIVRLFWGFVSGKREMLEKQTAQTYDRLAERYGLKSTALISRQDDAAGFITQASALEEAMKIGRAYKQAYDVFKKTLSLEQLDQQLAKNKDELSHVAGKLWNKWLLSQEVSFTAGEREDMTSFVSSIKLTGDVDLSDYPELKKQFSKLTNQMTKYLQSWAVTSLSAKSRIPFEAGLFDYLIIDEASQCDIASILPLLYRAKRAVIIGDPTGDPSKTKSVIQCGCDGQKAGFRRKGERYESREDLF